MKIIGITGKSGSGKTTLSNMLGKNENSKIVHMDYILDEIKNNKLLKRFTQNAQYISEKENSRRIIKSKLSNYIYDNNVILPIYLRIRRKIINKLINRQIQECENENVELLIIEGVDLANLGAVNKINFLVLLKAPYRKRLDRVIVRDRMIDKTEFVKRDQKSQKDKKRLLKRKADMVIENSGSLQDLENRANSILRRLNEKEMTSESKFRQNYKYTKSLGIIKHMRKGKKS